MRTILDMTEQAFGLLKSHWPLPTNSRFQLQFVQLEEFLDNRVV